MLPVRMLAVCLQQPTSLCLQYCVYNIVSTILCLQYCSQISHSPIHFNSLLRRRRSLSAPDFFSHEWVAAASCFSETLIAIQSTTRTLRRDRAGSRDSAPFKRFPSAPKSTRHPWDKLTSHAISQWCQTKSISHDTIATRSPPKSYSAINTYWFGGTVQSTRLSIWMFNSTHDWIIVN